MSISREQYIETALRGARDHGWTDFEVQDDGGEIIVLMRAEGSVEMMASGSLATLAREVREVGCATDYPAIEEYASHEDPQLQYVEPQNKWDAIAMDPADAPGDAAMGVDAGVQARVDAGDPDPFGEEALNAFDDRVISEMKGADAAAAAAEAADHADEPSVLDTPEPELPDPFVPAEVVELAQEPLEVKIVRKAKKPSRSELMARCKALKIVGYSGLRVKALQALIRNAERHLSDLGEIDATLQRLEAVTGEQGLVEDYNEPEPPTISPKEVASSGDLQDRGGFPHPEQVVSLSAETLAALDQVIEFKDRAIVARQGNDARVLGSRIKASVKAQWESEGWTFTHTTKEEGRKLLRTITAAKRAAAGIGTAAVSVTHKSGEALVERHPNGRVYAKPGYRFRVFKGNKSFEAATVNEALWRSKGWDLAVKAV